MSLYVQQGNTRYFRIVPTLNGEEYILSENDRIIFTVRRTARDDPVIRKVLTREDYADEELILKLDAKETELSTGDYKYDCSIEMSDGERYTFITPDDFIVKETVTDWGKSNE